MVQVINNVMIIPLCPEDEAKSLLEQMCWRFEKMAADNALLRLELERIRQHHEQSQRLFLQPNQG